MVTRKGNHFFVLGHQVQVNGVDIYIKKSGLSPDNPIFT